MGRKAVMVNFAIVKAIGYLLVVIGFFMPIARGRGNGFDVANRFIDGIGGFGANTLMGILMYAVFAAAVIGLVIGVLSVMSRKTKISAGTGWIVLLVCTGSGLVVFFAELNGPALQNGGILILIGWIAALVGQVLSKSR